MLLIFQIPYFILKVVKQLRDLSFGDDIVIDYEGINKINTGEGNERCLRLISKILILMGMVTIQTL